MEERVQKGQMARRMAEMERELRAEKARTAEMAQQMAEMQEALDCLRLRAQSLGTS